jgi:hypothetical protein
MNYREFLEEITPIQRERCERELTREQVRQWMMQLLAEAGPEERREMISSLNTCPCCERWMGHNHPPDDPPFRVQKSFDFKK